MFCKSQQNFKITKESIVLRKIAYHALSKDRRALKKGRVIIMKVLNLQDIILNTARKEKIPVTIFLQSGYQFKGIVKGFDSFVIVMDCDGKQNMVYKHAISTIIPTRSVDLTGSNDA